MMHSRYRRKRQLFSAALFMVFAGCANPSHLVFYQSTILGVDVATNAQGGTVHATLGYDRQTNAFIPKTINKDDNGKDQIEAMSLISKTDVDVEWLLIQQIHERFATGDAAVNLATKPDAIKALSEREKKK